MGASVSLPGPFAQFSRLSLSDVDEMIIRHRTQLDGAFMVTPQELEAIVGPKVKDAAAIIAQLEAGEEGKINALSFLCGAVAVCRTPAPGGGGDREDGVKAKARRMFALFDFGRARALTPSELGILLLSLGRALESFMGLRRGKSCVAFEDMAALDNAARVAVGKYDGALKQGMREGRGGGEDFSDVELGAPDASGTQGQEAARLPRKDFVEWSLRVLNPYCRPPVVLDALRKLVRASSAGDLNEVGSSTRKGLEQMSILGAEAAALMMDDSAYEPDPVPTKPEIDGDGAWVPFAAKKTERESGWLLEQVCKVPALAKLTRREQGVVIDAFRRKVFQGGQRLYVQGKGTDYLYLIEDGHVAVDADGGFTGQRNLPAADGTRHVGDQDVMKAARAHTATAATACSAWALDKLTLSEILKDSQHKKRMLYATALKRVPLLGGLDGSKVAQIVDASTAHDYDTGQLILRESEPGADFFVILNGSVECTRYVAGANDSVCPTLETGDFFGELSLTTGAPRAATCIALAECECLKIPKDIFKAIIEKPCAGGLARDYKALEEQAMAQNKDAEARARARRAKRKSRKRAGESPRAGDPVDPAEMRSLGGVSFIATIPDFTPRSANKSFRGQMAEKMSGKVNTETGADVTARHVHVQGVKAGSLVMEIFLESATDEEAIAAALEAAGFGKDVIAQSEVKISNIEIHKRHIGKGMAEEEIRKREEESAAREIHAFKTQFLNAARRCFELIDKDGGGTLSKEEIVEAVKKDEEVIKFLSTCGDENLEFLLHPPRLQKALEILDTDKSGELDVDECTARCRIHPRASRRVCSARGRIMAARRARFTG